MAALCLLLLGTPCFLSATTYRLKRVSQVESAEKYVFEMDDHAIMNTLSSSALNTTTPFKKSGLLGNEAYVWTLNKSGSYFKIKSASSNTCLTNSSSSSISFGSGSNWYFTFRPDGTAVIRNNSNSNYYLTLTDVNVYQFKAYGSNVNPYTINIYKLVEETDDDPCLNFSSPLVTMKLGDEIECPILTKSASYEGNITYSSSNTDVAEVNSETGAVIIKAAGCAKISATASAHGTFTTDETFYTIRVLGGDGSSATPYTVGDVLNGFVFPDNTKYVQGYVAGYFSDRNTLSTTAASSDNVAISDIKGETAYDKTLIVSLNTTQQADYGLGSHADMIGSQLIIKGRLGLYMAAYGFSDAVICSVLRDVTIGSTQFATYGSTFATDFSSSPVRAYSAGVSGGKVELSLITDGIVPANQGTILYCATPGTYAVPVTTETGTCSDTGLGISDGSSATGSNLYVLASRSDTVGFYRWTSDSSLPKGRVYLDASAGAPEYLAFSFGQTTDVERVTPARPKVDEGTVYNLQGQRVERPVRGLYIMGGRKVLVK